MIANSEGSRELTRVQVYKYVTKNRVLDIGDMLNIESRRSKIALTLVDFDENYRATTRVTLIATCKRSRGSGRRHRAAPASSARAGC